MSSDVIAATGLAGRYATALFELADADNALEAVSGDLETLGAMIDESDDLTRLIRSPVISREDQSRAMDAVLEAAGIGELTQKFIGVVAANRRLFALPSMIKGFAKLLADRRGETTAEVVSASELSDSQLDAVKQSLKKAMGVDVAIDARVDEEILGGLVVRVGSRMVDSSLKTKLDQLRFAMKGIG